MDKNSKSRVVWTIALILLLAFVITACDDATATPAAPVATEEPPQAVEPSEEPPTPPPTPTLEPTQEPTEEPALAPLPPERQPIEIITADGRTLEGYYYPARVNPAPVIVLMHWAPGTMDDWQEIAPWLQNRQDEMANTQSWQDVGISWRSNRTITGPWLDPTWFFVLPDWTTFGVVIFNFGDYGASEAGDIPESWAQDALAAVKKASELEGVDPNQIAAIGASIGADGAVDGCYEFNMDPDRIGTCLGALSLSPGNYLTQRYTYAEAVDWLDAAGYIVWCLYAVQNTYDADTCLSATGEHYMPIGFPGDGHGMMLVQPTMFPINPARDVDTLVIIVEFLAEVFGLPIFDM